MIAGVLAWAGRAQAQVDDMPAQDTASNTAGSMLFDAGRELAKANKYAEACAKFEQSYALDNGIGTELNLADCHEHLGHWAQAWRLFDDAQQRISDDNEGRSKFAHGRAAALLRKLAMVVVNVPDPTLPALSVTVAGRAVKVSAVITEHVDPGPIVVEVAQPGTRIFAQTKEADAGATVIFDVATPAVVEVEPPGARRHTRVVISLVVAGGGLALLASGIVVGIVADGQYNDAVDPRNGCMSSSAGLVCPDGQRQKAIDAGGLADVGTGLGVVGIAAIVSGAILYATAPKDLVVTPMASNRSAGLAISGRF